MRKIIRTTSILLISSLLICLISKKGIQAQTVNSWITEANQSQLLQPQSTVTMTAFGGTTIYVNPSTTYQGIDGFGFTLTEGSAEVINGLNAGTQSTLLNELFNTSTGLGISVIRISIGASDMSSSSYSYDDAGPDPSLTSFSLAGPDLTYLIPLIKKILLINPGIKVLATPWSAPRWMKNNNAWVGGSLNASSYSTYADYFVKYITAMQAQGINIWAITPQNEPENGGNTPSMTMTATEQTNFINNNLGPAMAAAGFGSIKIIGYDHNCDDTAYPIQVCGSSYVDGAAFHHYESPYVSNAMSTVHSTTGKNIYFTEQYTSSGGSFGGDFPWHMNNVMLNATTNWARIALEWNLATDGGFGPHTSSPTCTDCQGAITITGSSSYNRNVSYYIVGHFSKFVKTGATHIQSTNSDGNLSPVAFKNADGSIALVVYNNGSGRWFSVGFGSNAFNYYLNGSSAVTFLWNVPLPVELINFEASFNQNTQTVLSWSTVQESHSNYFVVEKSNDGIIFYSTDTVKAQGNSSILIHYTNTDHSLLSETIYYRLKQVDIDGSSKYSNIIFISPPASDNNNELLIYPNPSEGNNFTIEWKSNLNKDVIIEIDNLLGESIAYKTVNRNDNIFDGKTIPEKIPGGVYVIKVSGSTLKRKFIVN